MVGREGRERKKYVYNHLDHHNLAADMCCDGGPQITVAAWPIFTGHTTVRSSGGLWEESGEGKN